MWSILILFIFDVFNEVLIKPYKCIGFIKKTLLNDITPIFAQIKKTVNGNSLIK